MPFGFVWQIVPAMFGMFVYKAAALVQVYRDNEDLALILPENLGNSSDWDYQQSTADGCFSLIFWGFS